MSHFPAVKLTDGKDAVRGELVIESSNAFQVAVDGKVGVYPKDKWTQVSEKWSDITDRLEDILGGLRGGTQ